MNIYIWIYIYILDIYEYIYISCTHWRKSESYNLAKLVHLLVGVWIELVGHVLHPQQRPAVLRPGLLHPVHRQPRVRDGSVAEGLHLLVQAAQRVPQGQSEGWGGLGFCCVPPEERISGMWRLPLLGREAEGLPRGLHDLSSSGFILRALRAQEATQFVLLLGEVCTTGETEGRTLVLGDEHEPSCTSISYGSVFLIFILTADPPLVLLDDLQQLHACPLDGVEDLQGRRWKRR